MEQQEYQENRALLRMLVRTRSDFQDIRKALDNRIGRKANGQMQDLKEDQKRIFNTQDAEMLKAIADVVDKQESVVEKNLESVLSRFDCVYNWLGDQKGVGTMASSWLIGEFDVYKAETVSKMWQFSGMNPGLVRGRKSVKKSDYKPEMGIIIKELPAFKGGAVRVEVLTDTLVRGDRKTPGFLCPFHQRLRAALLGVLADGFIKAKSHYALDHYYALHTPDKYRTDRAAMKNRPELAGKYGRLDLSENLVEERRKGKVVQIAWKDTLDGHRDRAAKRKMVKGFLIDFYVAWRRCEGLSVRVPYAEEFLGKVHKKAA